MSNDLKEKFERGELLLFDNSGLHIPMRSMRQIFNSYMLNDRKPAAVDNDIYIVLVDGKEFHINSNWEPLYEERYDRVSGLVNGVAAAELDGKQFHISKDGKPLYNERYDRVGPLSMGVTTATENGKQFHIGKDGKPLYEERYDEISWFYGDSFIATLDNRQFHVGKDGKPLYEARYDAITMFIKDIARVYLDGNEYIINTSGERLQFETISEIGSRDDKLYIISTDNGYIFETGCFSGTIDEFEAAVKRTHDPETKPYVEYMEVIERYRGVK